MAKLLFKLTGVPDDEADDVRELLAEHGFEIYETSAGRWQISVAAIWLVDAADYPRAKELLAEYQAERTQRARADYEARVARGEQPTLKSNLAEAPGRMVAYTLIGVAVLALSTVPFIRLMW